MLRAQSVSGGTFVQELAGAHGADAWRVAVVAGADPAAATRAALHALVIGAVEGGAAAEQPAILALARSWAVSSPGAGPVPAGDEPVARAFWALPEAMRSALWRTDVLGLPAEAADAAVARGRVRREVCDRHRAVAGTGCAATADIIDRVLADRPPGAKKVLVTRHLAGCEECTRLLASVRDPAATVAAALLPAPDLGEQAKRAWREHVGAPRRTPTEQIQGAATVVAGRRRPVAAALALITAGTFAAASSQLAASFEGPAAPLALPISAAAPARPKAVVRPQAIIPPLAAEVASDPRFASLVTPELAQVTPLAAPPVPLPAPPPPPIPVAPPAPVGEPPPTAEPTTTVFDLPVPLPLPFSIEVGPECSSIRLGPFSLPLLCES